MKYEPADISVAKLAKEIMERHYEDLDELIAAPETLTSLPLKIDYVAVHPEIDEEGQPIGPAIKVHGVPAAGLCRIVNLRDRAMGRGDVEIQLDWYRWERMSDEEREALLAHEIHHITPVMDQDENVKRDDLGRVKIRLRKHDYEFGWFKTIAARYGMDSQEVKQQQLIWNEEGQSLFPFVERERARPTRISDSVSFAPGAMAKVKKLAKTLRDAGASVEIQTAQ